MAFTAACSLLKGGVGNTTPAVALAEAAILGGSPAVLVDADPHCSAVRWSVLAEEAVTPFRCNPIGLPAAELPRRIGQAAHGAVMCAVDAPPPGNLTVA